MELTQEQWDMLLRRLDGLESSIDFDRKDIDKVLIKLSKLDVIEAQVNRVLNAQGKQMDKTENIVHNAVADATEPLREVAQEIAEKPIKITKRQAENLDIIAKLRKAKNKWDNNFREFWRR